MATLKRLTLLHSNDMHGDFLAEQIDDTLVGGVSRLSGYLNKVRNEEENVLYAVAGDMFRGSVIDSEFQGFSTIEIMNMLGPDVATIGNHEVDYGVPHLLFLEKCATFPLVNANLHIKTNGRRLLQGERIIEIGGMKVLFIGVVTESVLSSAKVDAMVSSFLNIEEAAVAVGRICDAYNTSDVDLTVLLTHIGFEEDKRLAAQLNPDWGVDLIIGGHSHTLLDEPCVVNGIPIVQAGSGTDQIGRFDLVIDTDANAIVSYAWESLPVNDRSMPRDGALEDLIVNYKSRTDEKYARILTRFTRELTHPSRTQETELGNLFSDALADSFGVDLVLLGSGSIRVEKSGPICTIGSLCEAYPYNDYMVQITVTGEQLQRIIRHIVRDEAFLDHTEYYQCSGGLRCTFNFDTKEFELLTLFGKPVEPASLYTLAISAFHYTNMKDFLDISPEECAHNAPLRTLCTASRDVLEEWLMEHTNVNRVVEGRLLVKRVLNV